MAARIMAKTATTPEEAKLILATTIADGVDVIKQLLKDPKSIERMGEAAARSNALNEEEIKARDEAIQICETADQVRAEFDKREAEIKAAYQKLETDKKEALDYVENAHNSSLEEIKRKHAESDGVVEDARNAMAKAEERLAEANTLHGEARKRHEELDALKESLTNQQAHIDRVRSALGASA